MTLINTVREALNKAKSSHGITLTSYPPQDAWQFNRVDERIDAAIVALAELERTHYTAEDVADASAKGFRDGVASVTAEQQPVAWKHDCAALLANGVELWIDNCPHCGRPRAAPVAQQPQAEAHTSWCASKSMLLSDPPQSMPCNCKPHKTAPQQAEAVLPGWTFKRLSDGSIGIHAPAPKPGEKYQRTSDCVTPGHGDTYEILSRLVDHLEAPQQAEGRPIQECYGDCPTNPATCANPCKFNGRPAPQQAEAVPSDVVCNKDPQGCWNVRCQLGKVCKNAALAAAPKGQP